MKQLEGQISMFEFMLAKTSYNPLKPNCFKCLYYESNRCRNAKTCPEGMSFVEYTGSSVRQCLYADTEIYQDGFIHCPVIDCLGCERCMELFGEGEEYISGEGNNYERTPRKESNLN